MVDGTSICSSLSPFSIIFPFRLSWQTTMPQFLDKQNLSSFCSFRSFHSFHSGPCQARLNTQNFRSSSSQAPDLKHIFSAPSLSKPPQSKSPILQVRSTTPCDPCAKRTTYKKRARPASLCASTLRSGNLRGSQRLIQGSCTAHARLMMLVCVRCMFEDGLGVACEHTSGTSR